MNDPDEAGWSHIHHCALRGYTKSLERFVDNDPDCLELETQDDLQSTPFLLAITSGLQDSVQCLVNLGAKVDVANSQNHGAVEICAIKSQVSLLEYLLSLRLPQLPVWRRLLAMLGSDMDEEVFSAATCLRALTEPSRDGLNPRWEDFYNNGGVPVVVKVAKSSVADDSKVPALQLLFNVLPRPVVSEQLMGGGGGPAIIRLLKSHDPFLLQLAAMVLGELGKTEEHAEVLIKNGVIPALHHSLQAVHHPEVQTATLLALASIANAGPKHRTAVGTAPGCIKTIVDLFETAPGNADVQLALIEAVSGIAHDSRDNQNAFVNTGVTQHVISVILSQSRNKEVQEKAVETVHHLSDNNMHVQRDMLDRDADRLLLQVLKKRGNAESLTEQTALALWSLAGSDLSEKREMAAGIGIQKLIEFVNSSADNLQLIGSEGLGVLAQGPLNQQQQISAANGLHPMIRLLRSASEAIVLSAIRSLRHLCVSVGNIPCHTNQNTISASRGIKLLVALMVHSLNEKIQVEAAFTLASVSLGNRDILEEIQSNVDFSYVRLLKLLYSSAADVQLRAGWALATFAYNSLQQQREIGDQGGVRFACFLPFLLSDNELHKCCAAYQVVVLSRIMPDVEQTQSSASGIKLLADLLASSSDDVTAMAAACIACLAHTRAGVPAALVAVGVVGGLCDLLLSPSDHVRAHAAVALTFLSHHHQAHRHLLQRCRRDPYLMHVLKHYGKRYKMATPLTEGWKHYQKVGLPPISKGRPSLIRKQRTGDELGPITLLSVDTSPQGSGQRRGSEGRLPTIDTTGSGLSRASHHTTQSLVNNGHVSVTRHPTDAMILPEIVMVDEV